MKVFIYGTLKSGEVNSPLLEGQVFLGEAVTAEPKYRLYEVAGRYKFPAMVEREEGVRVFGELYDVQDHIVNHLDRLEGIHGNPPLYTRETISVYTIDGAKHETKVYLFAQDLGGLTLVGRSWPAKYESGYMLGGITLHTPELEGYFILEGSEQIFGEKIVSPEFSKFRDVAIWASENLTIFGGEGENYRNPLSVDGWVELLKERLL